MVFPSAPSESLMTDASRGHIRTQPSENGCSFSFGQLAVGEPGNLPIHVMLGFSSWSRAWSISLARYTLTFNVSTGRLSKTAISSYGRSSICFK